MIKVKSTKAAPARKVVPTGPKKGPKPAVVRVAVLRAKAAAKATKPSIATIGGLPEAPKPDLPSLPAEDDPRPAFLKRKDEVISPPASTEASSDMGFDPEAITSRVVADRKEAVRRAGFLFPGTEENVGWHIVKTGRGEFAILTGPRKAPDAKAAALASVRAPKAERKAAKKAARSPLGEVRKDGLREGTAAAKMVDLATRKEGVTYQELLDATGWSECRPAFYKACETAGLERRLEKGKDGEPSRYFAKRANA